jgi:hypothetical protein
MSDVEEVELVLNRAALQMKTKDQDTLYYNQLVAKTEQDIATCSVQIQNFKRELDEQLLLRQQKAEFESICAAINKYPPAQDT